MKPNEIDENYKAAYNKGFSVGYKKGYEKICTELHAGSACFLVKDERFSDWDNYFYTWLKDNGFECSTRSFSCYGSLDWLYINLNSKKYSGGKNGVSLAAIVGNHAITLKEFLQIYFIYKKYEGKKPLEF